MAKSKESFFEYGIISAGVIALSGDNTFDTLGWDWNMRAPSGSAWNAGNMQAVVSESYEIDKDCKLVSSFIVGQHTEKELALFDSWRSKTIPADVQANPAMSAIIRQMQGSDNYFPIGGKVKAVSRADFQGARGYENTFIELPGIQEYDAGDADYWMLMRYDSFLNGNIDLESPDNSIFHERKRWTNPGVYYVNGEENSLSALENPEWTLDFLQTCLANERTYSQLYMNSLCWADASFDDAWPRQYFDSPIFPRQLQLDYNNYNYHNISQHILAQGLVINGRLQHLPEKMRFADSSLARALNCGMDYNTFRNPPAILSGISLMDAWQRYEYELPETIQWDHEYTKQEWLDTRFSGDACAVALVIGKRGRGYNNPAVNGIRWRNNAWNEVYKGETLSSYLHEDRYNYYNRDEFVIMPHGFYCKRETFNKDLEELLND